MPQIVTEEVTEEAEVEWFYEDLQDVLELTLQKDVLFIIGNWNAKVRSLEDTKSNRQIWPWSIKCEAGQRLTEFCRKEHPGHSKHLLPTT